MADRLMIRNCESGAAATRLFISACGFLFSVVCFAEEFQDPTRPPVEIGALPSGRPAIPVGQSVAQESNGLQTIIISPGRRAAIIYGHEVELGGKLGNATLVDVNESGVVLESGRSGRNRRVLPLFPGVQMNMRASSQAVPESARSTDKAETGDKQ